ncbi:hypothetical protein GCM10011529_20420 [Polymorphobacter glacialis]|uniref:Beta-glucosidase n=1 Tax=Sandarakinorhabdus glacialis TaxID=1614636 RepID=A0A917EA32_9SPHN|nr:beta-glucosidase [Polymorphobacter glacialis]GGE13929.1 hypothetical protein GCM10011529_20420 [Polymorphobacter glacialis]
MTIAGHPDASAQAEQGAFRPLLGSMLLGGFECSAHKLRSGRRLDLIASTGHDLRAADDYALLQHHGMAGGRDGLRWHRIEQRPGRYDWSSFLPMLHAARDSGFTVAWDLLHYGLPNGLDVFSPAFITRFAAFARVAAVLVRAETDEPPTWTPINEISFWAFAGGEKGGLNPFARNRGPALKKQLARAALAAIDAVRSVDPRARIAVAEPLIHIFPADDTPRSAELVRIHNASQFEALDMLLGRRAPELGGFAGAVDIIGLNYYNNNQWVDHGRPVHLGDHLYLPLRTLLAGVAARYDQPLYIAETGTEGIFRPYWLRYVCDEVRAAIAAVANIGGICLYPIVSHLGWDDDRHCHNGLFEGHGPDCARSVDAALAAELALQVAAFGGVQPAAAPAHIPLSPRAPWPRYAPALTLSA